MNAWLSIMVLLLAGCVSTPLPPAPAVALSTQWRNGPAQAADGTSWWKAFGDPALDRLEVLALAANLDIAQAGARLEQARQGAGAAQSALAPTIDLEAAAGRAQQTLESGIGTLSKVVPSYPRTIDPGRVGLSAAWDLDFAGGLRRQREVAGARVAASAAEVQAVRLAITAEVADAYLTQLGARMQAALLEHQLALLAAQRRIMDARLKLGVASQTELDAFVARIAKASAPLATLRAAAEVQRNRLAVLLGRDPSAPDEERALAESLPIAPDPAGGTPAALLRQRPDVLASEQRVIGASAGVAVSMAEYYPRISLLAALGREASSYANLDSSRASFAQAFLGVRWRLFDFGRIDAEVAQAKGKQKEALLAYRAAVLRAAGEVESSFAQLAAARGRLAQLDEQGRQERRLAAAVRAACRAGAASNEEVMIADRSVASADFDIVAARLDVARSVVGAARALGGPIQE